MKTEDKGLKDLEKEGRKRKRIKENSLMRQKGEKKSRRAREIDDKGGIHERGQVKKMSQK